MFESHHILYVWNSQIVQTKIENDIFKDDIANKDNFEEETKDVFMKTMVHNFLDYDKKISSLAPNKTSEEYHP